jgi:gliding motility-associated-like protein
VPVALQFSTTTVPQNLSYASCDLDGTPDGFFGFTLANLDMMVLNGLPSGLVVNYYASVADAQAEQNTLPAVFTNTIIDQQTIYAKISNGPDCFGISNILLQVNRNQPANFGDSTVYLCPLASIDLGVEPLFNSYSWSTGASTNILSINEANTYTVTVTDAKGCEATKKFEVIASSAPIISSIQIDHFQPNGGTVTITVTGNGSYLYSLNGSNHQTSPVFTNVESNEYMLTVEDTRGCGKDTETIYVLDYPRFFTPNGDGFNDRWRIANLNLVYKAQLRIFDRFGKLLQEFNELSEGWDGLFLGQPLPADDYWFSLQFDSFKTISGHFCLKR